MVSLPDWVRPATASPEELAEQAQHAQRELAQAEIATAEAIAAFDRDPLKGAKQLAQARDHEAQARELHARAARLLAAAQEHEATQLRLAREARLAELERMFSGREDDRRRQPSLGRLLTALEEVAVAQVDRIDCEMQLASLELERRRLEHQLHQVEPPDTPPSSDPRVVDVVQGLQSRAAQHEPGSRLHTTLLELARTWGRS